MNTCLPIFSAIFDRVAGDFRLIHLVVDSEGADRVLHATVTWKHAVIINGNAFEPDPRGTASASTLLAHALLGPLVSLVAVCGWPTWDRWRACVEIGSRIVTVLPMMLLLLVIDVPIVLAGEVRQFVFEALGSTNTSFLVIWKTFMQAGGRFALSLAAAVLAVYMARGLMVLSWPGQMCRSTTH